MQRITVALKEQGGMEFQEFCDHFLFYKYPNRMSTAFYGAQLEMRNPIKGHPDSFFRLADGRLFYVESTGQQQGLANKIRKDIEMAIQEVHNHTYQGKLNLIFNVKSRHEKELDNLVYEIAEKHEVNIFLNTIDSIAQEIYLQYPMLGKYLLGIATDTGQIEPLHKFISQYEKRSHHLATPLTNQLINRDGLHENVCDLIEKHDLIILSGTAGVGKTRTALEAIHSFVLKHPEYKTFAIVSKYRDLVDDLDQTLQKDQKYLLFIDDANRQLHNFHQVLGSYLEGTAHLKIVLSVRNYALKEVDEPLSRYNFKNLSIPIFSNAEILAILESDTFKITNFQVKQRILKIAQGKPRLAIMAAISFNKKGGEFLIDNALSLFEAYFQEILKETGLFQNRSLLRVMGIMSFFYTLDLNDRELLDKILLDFNMDYQEFIEGIHKLEYQEFLETQGTYVKISEQLLSMYFFFKGFIQQPLLSLQTLLKKYSDQYYYRIRDVLKPILETFPKHEAWTPIAPILYKHLNETENKTAKLEIYEITWFYVPDRVLLFLSDDVNNMMMPENPVYKIEGKYFAEERKVGLLRKFLINDTPYFPMALDIFWEYLRKNPDSMGFFINILEEVLKQHQPTPNYMLHEIEFYENLHVRYREKHILPVVLPIIKFYLASPGLTLGSSYNHLKCNKLVWDLISKMFSIKPAEVLKLLMDYDPHLRINEPAILHQEICFLFAFIQNKLQPDQVIHNYLVNQLIFNLEEMKALPQNWSGLKDNYQNVIQERSQALKWEQIMNFLEERGKQDYEQSLLIKEDYLITRFDFKNIKEFEEFLKHVNILSSFQISGFWFEHSLDLLLNAHFKKNSDFGMQLLQTFQRSDLGFIVLGQTVQTIVSGSSIELEVFWNQIKQFPNPNKLYYRYQAIRHIPQPKVKEDYISGFLNSLQSYEGRLYIDFKPLSKFQDVRNGIFKETVELIYKKNQETCLIQMDPSFFVEYLEHFKNDYVWIRRIYFSQKEIEKKPFRFDPRWQALQKVIQHFPQFLYDFGVKYYLQNLQQIKYIHTELGFIWNSEIFFPWIEKLLNSLQTTTSYYVADNGYLKYIFQNNNNKQQEIIHRFLHLYLLKNLSYHKRIDLIFKAAKLLTESYFQRLLSTYLDQEPEPEQFKNILWCYSSNITINGSANTGEVQRKKWEKLQEYVNEGPITPAILPIREYIELQIIQAQNQAKRERLRQFLYK